MPISLAFFPLPFNFSFSAVKNAGKAIRLPACFVLRREFPEWEAGKPLQGWAATHRSLQPGISFTARALIVGVPWPINYV